jgi:hypothetical protein
MAFAFVLLTLSAAPASATVTRPYLKSFGVTAGSNPQNLAFDSGGDLYILETSPAAIEKVDADGDPVPFSASASYIDGNKLTGTPDFSFQFEGWIPAGLAVSTATGPTNGYIYVTTFAEGGGVFVFDASGTYKGFIPSEGNVCSVAVNQANGDVYTSDFFSEQVRRFVPADGDPANDVLQSVLKPVGIFPCELASDSTGAVYVSGFPYWGVATKYDASQFGVETASGTPLEASPSSQFAIDPSNDDVYADMGSRIDHFDSSGAPIAPSIADGDIAESWGLARAPDGRLYASEASAATVSVYGPTALDLPLVTSGEPTAVLQNTATLSGQVDPDSAGDVSSCEFKYGLGKSYSAGSVPCSPAVSAGSPITSSQTVSAALTGLAPGTVYHYRLFAGNANGTAAGHDRTFTTPVAVEGVTTGAATDIAKDGATLTGSFIGDGQDTKYYFRYGTDTSYGQREPTPDADAGSASGQQSVAPIRISGLQGETTYHYQLVASNSYGSTYGADQTFTTSPAVTNLTADAPVDVTNESVKLAGSFDADQYDTSYYFEYGPTAAYGTATPAPPGNDAGTGSGRLQVEPVGIDGLQQGAVYHFRIVATNSRGTTVSADRTFRTADAPAINSFATENVKNTSADLHATINPRGGETSYHFEYGPTVHYGTSVPIPDEAIGAGEDDVAVGAHLEDLVSGVTYHFQVVAQNQYGTTKSGDQTFGFYPPSCPNAQVRQETNSNHVPDCRAYEIASAAFAGGTTVFPASGPNTGLATSPARLAYGGGYGAIPGSGDPINTMGDLYVATRTNSGWFTKYIGLGGNQTQEMGGPPEAGLIELINQEADWNQIGTQASPRMDRILSYNDGNPVYGAKTGSNAPFIWDSSTNQQVARWPSNLDQIQGGEDFIGKPRASADFTHFVFSSDVVFAPGGEARPEPFEPPPAAPGELAKRTWPASVYDDNIVTGEVKLASVRNDGTGFAALPLAISTDGSHILMTEGSNSLFREPAPLLLRVDGESTYELAEGRPVTYVGSTADGRTVYFTSAETLTSDDTDTSVDLFRWSQSEPDSVTRVSFGDSGEAGNSDACSVTWVEKCGVGIISFASYAVLKGGLGGNRISDNFVASQSGDIYFESPEQLDGAKGEFGQVNLYLYRDGRVRFVATMSATPLCALEQGSYRCSDGPVARMQVTPDGDHVAFITPSRITSYDNGGKGEMYTYAPETDRLVCVSCKPHGELPKDDVYASQNGLFLTDDGRVFFSTTDGIVRQDTNEQIDVYEFVGGRPQLLTTGIGPGTGDKFAGFTGLFARPGLVSVSADGVDAYFATFDRLVTQDHNGEQLKIYDARTNGGFPSDLPPPQCAAADECHEAGSTPPPKLIDGTGANLGSGSNVVSHRKKHRKAHRGKHHRRHKAHHPKGKRGKKGKRGSGHRRRHGDVRHGLRAGASK